MTDKFYVLGTIVILTPQGNLTIDNKYNRSTHSDFLTDKNIRDIIAVLKIVGVPRDEYRNSEDSVPIYEFTDKKGNTWCADDLTKMPPAKTKAAPKKKATPKKASAAKPPAKTGAQTDADSKLQDDLNAIAGMITESGKLGRVRK